MVDGVREGYYAGMCRGRLLPCPGIEKLNLDVPANMTTSILLAAAAVLALFFLVLLALLEAPIGYVVSFFLFALILSMASLIRWMVHNRPP